MILKKNHKIPLDKFIDYSLYNKKNGYYMKQNPFGEDGDYTTAPNISRLFSEMIAVWTISFWENLGSPNKFNLIELGAGNGFIHEKSSKLIKEQKKILNSKILNG